jgi:diphthamide biosynthesis protein 2
MFDLDGIASLIILNGFKLVALQFPDEHLNQCTEVYTYLSNKLSGHDVDLFIIGDSTFGSSVDDISAQHVDSDVLVYLGSDMSSSGSMPVIVAPYRKSLNLQSCVAKVMEQLNEINEVDDDRKVILLYEPAYYENMQQLSEELLLLNDARITQVEVARVPPCADIQNWSKPACAKKTSDVEGGYLNIGGLFVSESAASAPETIVCYIGGKQEQLVSIILRLSESTIISFNPLSNEAATLKGSASRDFRERYGGLLRVKDANIIGIIVGSMGLSIETTRQIVDRLEALISTARKNSYVFVMGRLNEAKLCNFPEVRLGRNHGDDASTAMRLR